MSRMYGCGSKPPALGSLSSVQPGVPVAHLEPAQHMRRARTSEPKPLAVSSLLSVDLVTGSSEAGTQ